MAFSQSPFPTPIQFPLMLRDQWIGVERYLTPIAVPFQVKSEFGCMKSPKHRKLTKHFTLPIHQKHPTAKYQVLQLEKV